MTDEEPIFLGLGSNVGDRLAHLQGALSALADLPHTEVKRHSSVYETEPVGYEDQPDFLNMVAEVATEIAPEAFLEATKNIEYRLGRVRDVRWGPRRIDIDILYWGMRVLDSERLQVPHPQARRRRFVLVPLNEIAPEFAPPPEGVPVSTLLERVADPQRVERFLPKESFSF